MPINYVDAFETQLQQKYNRELTSSALTTDRVRFMGARNIRIPRMDLAGYQDHNRAGGWNRQQIDTDFEVKTLMHDRDVEFYVDAMDVDETNQIVSAANITNTFVTEHAVPELDCFRYSKIFTEYVGLGGQPDDTLLDPDNILQVYDQMMENMDEAEVPEEGRLLYVTPAVHTLLKQASEMMRIIQVTNNNRGITRAVRSLDDVRIIKVPSVRMMTAYDFTVGAVPGPLAKQINMILVHPSAILAPIKHRAIYLWPPGTHTGGDGWLYQNRSYTDLFLIERKFGGVQINVEP